MLHRLQARGLFLGLVLSLAIWATRPLDAVVVISEIMYHPQSDDRDLEFIELTNETPDPLDLTGYYFASGVDFTFTDRTFIDPGAIIVVCANKEKLAAKYGITNVAGNWTADTSLDDSGEAIELSNPAGVVEARVRYNDRGKWPSGADGTGHSLEIKYLYTEMDDPDSWALSGKLGGSPGVANNPTAGLVPVVINEGLLTGNSGERWIELYNRGDADVDLAGFHLTNDRADLKKATLAAGTSISARKWLVLSDSVAGLDLGPDKSGRAFVALVNPEGDRVIDARIFEPNTADPSLSEARIPDGDSLFERGADPTPNAANKVTVQSDVVINEIMYHPIDGDQRNEFLELFNRGTQPVELAGWSISEGVRFDFPNGTTIAPEGYLVVARDPENIKSIYGLAASAVVGPAADDADALDRFGSFADSGERVTITDARGNIVDTVRYFDGGEWPRWADGGGSSMELIDPNQDNSRAQAWDSSDDAQKSQPTTYSYDGTVSGSFSAADPAEFHLVMTDQGITVIDDLRMTSQITTYAPETIFVPFDDTWKLKKGLTEASDPVTAWRQVDFDDASWTDAQAIIGFGDADEKTVLDDMRKFDPNPGYASFFVRKAFNVADPGAFQGIALEIEYDDGFVAYLNGVEVASGNMKPGDRAFTAVAISAKEKQKDLVDLTAHKDLLKSGRNVLAIQVHNQSLASNDARFNAQLSSGTFKTEEGPNLFKDGAFETDTFKSSWVIQGTHVRSGRTVNERISGEGSLKLISSGGGDNKVNRIETSNTGLAAPLVRVVYHISYLAKWVCGTPTLLTHGSYVSSSPPSYATSTRLVVPKNLGTPGAPNSVTLRQIARVGSKNMGPVIDKVNQTPALPAANEVVTVNARIHDPDGVASATLYYSIDTPKEIGDAALLSLDMTDPDGDGIYTAQVPGQLVKKRVVYFIVAKDSKDQSGRWPLDHVNRTNPLILDPATATANDDNYAVYRHDTPFSGKPQSFRFWLHQANEQYLNSRPLHSNDLVDGTFLFQNRDIYYNSKIRFSGSPWARQAWSESYRMRMPKDHPLNGSIDSFNMEDHQDGGARSAKERISHYLFRWHQGQSIVPYSLQWYVRLQVNDKVNEDRELVQTPNSEFLSRWWPDDSRGAFFEMDDRHVFNDSGLRQDSLDGFLLYPPYGSATLGADKEQYRYYFSTRSNEDQDDFSELINLARLMTTSQTPNDQFDEQVWDQVDVESFCRYWSIRMNTDDWDCWGTTRGKNCYIYRPSGIGKWYLLPWDMELTYGDVSARLPPAMTATSNASYGNKFPEVTRFINRPRIKRLYYGIMKEMLDKQFRSPFLLPYMQKLDAVGALNTIIGKPNGYIDQRAKLLQGIVRGVTQPVIDFTITTNGGQPLEIETADLELQGKAPVEISQIAVNVDGKPAGDSWTVQFSNADVLGWTAVGKLPLGDHQIELVGMNSDLEVVDSVSIQVNVISPGPPTITAVAPSRAVEGELVTLTGTRFKSTSKVLFGAVAATQVTFDAAASTQLVAAVPPGVPVGAVDVRVENAGGIQSEPFPIQVVAAKKKFLRGDSDRSGQVNLTDAIYSLRFLFQGGEQPLCMDAADVDDDGAVNLTDAIVALRFLFQGGAQPPAPFPDLAEDPTPGDALDCAIGLE